jgi:hypothetical protein
MTKKSDNSFLGIRVPQDYRLVLLQKTVEENAIFDDFKTYKVSNAQCEFALIKGTIPTLDDEVEVEEFLSAMMANLHQRTEGDVDALVRTVEKERRKQFERMQRLKRKHVFQNPKEGDEEDEKQKTKIEIDWDTDEPEPKVKPKPKRKGKGKGKPKLRLSL